VYGGGRKAAWAGETALQGTTNVVVVEVWRVMVLVQLQVIRLVEFVGGHLAAGDLLRLAGALERFGLVAGDVRLVEEPGEQYEVREVHEDGEQGGVGDDRARRPEEVGVQSHTEADHHLCEL